MHKFIQLSLITFASYSYAFSLSAVQINGTDLDEADYIMRAPVEPMMLNIQVQSRNVTALWLQPGKANSRKGMKVLRVPSAEPLQRSYSVSEAYQKKPINKMALAGGSLDDSMLPQPPLSKKAEKESHPSKRASIVSPRIRRKSRKQFYHRLLRGSPRRVHRTSKEKQDTEVRVQNPVHGYRKARLSKSHRRKVSFGSTSRSESTNDAIRDLKGTPLTESAGGVPTCRSHRSLKDLMASLQRGTTPPKGDLVVGDETLEITKGALAKFNEQKMITPNAEFVDLGGRNGLLIIQEALKISSLSLIGYDLTNHFAVQFPGFLEIQFRPRTNEGPLVVTAGVSKGKEESEFAASFLIQNCGEARFVSWREGDEDPGSILQIDSSTGSNNREKY